MAKGNVMLMPPSVEGSLHGAAVAAAEQAWELTKERDYAKARDAADTALYLHEQAIRAAPQVMRCG